MEISTLIAKLVEQERMGVTKVVFHIVDTRGEHYEENQFSSIGDRGDDVLELIITL